MDPPAPPLYVHRGRPQLAVPDWGPQRDAAAPRLVVVIPTLADRCGVEALWQRLVQLEVALSRAQDDGTLICGVIVAIQARSPAVSAALEERLVELEDRWVHSCGHGFLGVRMPCPSKLLALSACRDAVSAFGAQMVAWYDDDVHIDEHCVRRLVARFDPAHPGIYGGRKIAVPDRSGFSAWWSARKNRIEAINAYPHGCAVLLSAREFQRGIPLNYQSDDNYYVLEHIDVDAIDDPLWRLVVVPDAVVRVPSTNDILSTCRRVARNYRNGLRVMVDASSETTRYFMWKVIFSGLRFPRAAAELLAPAYWSGLAWHSIKLLFWVCVAAEVVVRGVGRRPRGVEWYTAAFPGTDSH